MLNPSASICVYLWFSQSHVRTSETSLTLSANFLTVQVFAFRESEGDLGQVARATKPERLLQLFPASPDWMSWPPPITIDDEALDVLDTRFVKVLGGSVPRRVEI